MPASNAFAQSIADSATSATLLPADPGRLGALIRNDSTEVLFVKLGTSLASEASTTITVDDSDTAASDGVAIYVVIDEVGLNYDFGHFEFVSPTNVTNPTIRLKVTTGLYVAMVDNDNAAKRGTVLKIIAAEGGFQADMPGTKQVLVPIYTDAFRTQPSGTYIRVLNGSATAVQLYVDEDGTNNYERIQGVIVDNGNETALATSFSATASNTDYTEVVGPGETYETDFAGIISGIWAADASGSARITELT